MNKQEIDKIRSIMGTLPGQASKKTTFVNGCSAVKAKLCTWTNNPYKAIFEAATATWGTDEYKDKWSVTPFESKVDVVRSALGGNTLPQALEPIMLMFKVTGVSRAAFDQWARARLATFFSSGVRDNSKLDASYIIPTEYYENPEARAKIEKYVTEGKDLYEFLTSNNQGSWQDGRSVLWMNMQHPFYFAMNYGSLKGQLSNRLKFCEMFDTVGLAWSLREEIKKKFPLLAAYLRPGCDWGRKCQYHKNYTMSEVFGCLFKECGRNKCDATDGYSTFNRACSDSKTISKQLGINIPTTDEERPEDFELTEMDAKYFDED